MSAGNTAMTATVQLHTVYSGAPHQTGNRYHAAPQKLGAELPF